MRGKFSALSDGATRHLCFTAMKRKVLSVFVDESGRFVLPDGDSRFYIIGFVLHDQGVALDEHIQRLEQSWFDLGLTKEHCFHAGPLIRREQCYEALNREFRIRVFSRMMSFARKIDFQYRCVMVDKKFVDSVDQMVVHLKREVVAFLLDVAERFSDFNEVKVYYDCGQSRMTNLLQAAFAEAVGGKVTFAQDVKPGNYRMFQLADLVCTIVLINAKLEKGERMTLSEYKFFGGPKAFKHNILRYIKAKEV